MAIPFYPENQRDEVDQVIGQLQLLLNRISRHRRRPLIPNAMRMRQHTPAPVHWTGVQHWHHCPSNGAISAHNNGGLGGHMATEIGSPNSAFVPINGPVTMTNRPPSMHHAIVVEATRPVVVQTTTTTNTVQCHDMTKEQGAQRDTVAAQSAARMRNLLINASAPFARGASMLAAGQNSMITLLERAGAFMCCLLAYLKPECVWCRALIPVLCFLLGWQLFQACQ